MNPKFRPIMLFLFLFSLCMLAGSYILQYGFHLLPCPLCLLDRFLVIALSFVFLLALLHNPPSRAQKIYSLLGFVFIALGITITARHLWMLHLPPDQVPACGPSLHYLIETLPLKEALWTVFKGSGECADNRSMFLGLSLPGWTMVGFIILAVGNLLSAWREKR